MEGSYLHSHCTATINSPRLTLRRPRAIAACARRDAIHTAEVISNAAHLPPQARPPRHAATGSPGTGKGDKGEGRGGFPPAPPRCTAAGFHAVVSHAALSEGLNPGGSGDPAGRPLPPAPWDFAFAAAASGDAGYSGPAIM